MRLFNVINNQWFDATDFTVKAFKEGRRPHLFDREPSIEEADKARDLIYERNGNDKWVDTKPVDNVVVESDANQNWKEVTDFGDLPSDFDKVMGEYSEGGKYSFEASIMDLNGDLGYETTVDDDYQNHVSTLKEGGHVLEIYTSSYIKGQIICDPKLDQVVLYTNEGYEREYSNDNQLKEFVEIGYDYSPESAVSDIEGILKNLGVQYDVVEEGESIKIRYKK